MDADFEEKLRKEIRKRAFARWDRLRHEKQRRQDIQHNLDALYEVTGLSRSELESIARDARMSCMYHDENFFSIKNQVLAAGAIIGVVFIVVCLFITV